MFQLRHKVLGYFQGIFLGFLFFTEDSPDVPLKDRNGWLQGITEFSTEAAAEEFLEELSKTWTYPYDRADFFIEPFDKDLNALWLGMS